MKLEFNRIVKPKMVGLRLTEDEYKRVKRLADENSVSVAEASAVLVRAALKEIQDN